MESMATQGASDDPNSAYSLRKNYPKVTKALVGEVIGKIPSEKKVILEEDRPVVEDVVIETEPDEKDAISETTESDPGKLKKPTKTLKHVIEKVDFLMEEVKGLRAYIRKLEDEFVYQNGKEALPEGNEVIEPAKRRKRKS